MFLRDCNAAIDDIRSRGKIPVLCGGTGLYVESVLKGLSLPQVPENPKLREQLKGLSLEELAGMLASMKALHNTTDIDSVKRAIRAIEIQEYYSEHPDEAVTAVPHPVEDAVIIGVDIDRENRRSRIEARLKSRLAAGMADEVKGLLDNGISPEDLIYYGLEYKFLTLYVTGQLTFDEMYTQLLIAIHQFAKRQMTWFRGMSRRGFDIHWIPWDAERCEFVERVLSFVKL